MDATKIGYIQCGFLLGKLPKLFFQRLVVEPPTFKQGIAIHWIRPSSWFKMFETTRVLQWNHKQNNGYSQPPLASQPTSPNVPRKPWHKEIQLFFCQGDKWSPSQLSLRLRSMSSTACDGAMRSCLVFSERKRWKHGPDSLVILKFRMP